ncbi:outer membrane beta-barrel protein [Pelagicoccus mobilis]|uniref:Outer membrane beta-barrel protein n=1 Tax=Pelagicoccus mobilis TaxID=415221 RepID=A0A934RYF3_9BACT|nr:outer membrane beta-barrel protein [Pelagicoccus mobilis]MBK1877785.1 outer membrane beta-barrel protein [Pelagicoccus mobilis]
MNSIKTVALTLTAAALAASSAQAEKWTFAIKGSYVEPVGGDVHRGASFDGSVLLDLDPGSLPVEVDAKSFNDVYGDFWELGLEATYHASSTTSWFVGLSTMQADDGMLQVGTVADSLPLNGHFSDYEDLGLYGGIRYHFVNEGNWQPFVSAQVGFKDIDSIRASFSVPDVTFVPPYQDALTDAPFYDGGTVFSYGVGVGLAYQMTESSTLSFETGYYGQESMDDDDSVLDVLGLGALNDEGDLEYMPITMRFNFAF